MCYELCRSGCSTQKVNYEFLIIDSRKSKNYLEVTLKRWNVARLGNNKNYISLFYNEILLANWTV